MKRKFTFSLILVLVGFIRLSMAQTCSAGFTYAIDTAHHSVTFHDTSSISGHLITYAWTFGDGHASHQQNPTVTYAHPGTYYVCLTVTADTPHCSSTFCDSIVIPNPPANCDADFMSVPSSNLTINFMDHSLSSHTITSWTWDFGDGSTSTSPNPSHQYADTGIYNVCLMISDMNGLCVDTFCHPVYVTASTSTCAAAFTFATVSAGNVDFTNTSAGTGPHTIYHWSFGNGHGSSHENPFYSYPHPGTYYVCLTISDNNCHSTFCDSVTITQPTVHTCNADFQFLQTAHSVNFHNMSSGHFLNYTWDFGDGHSSHMSNPSHQYADTGHYVVCLYVSNPHCSDTICQTISVAHVNHCQASFTLDVDTTTGDIIFTNTSSIAATDFLWTFGDGDSSNLQNPTHSYAISGHYTVCLFINDTVSGCSAHSCFVMHTHHSPHFLALSLTLFPDENPSTGIEQINSPFALKVYPNPVSNYTNIEYTLEQKSKVRMEVYNLIGEIVLSSISKNVSAGNHTEQIDVRRFVEGTYILKLTFDNKAAISKIIIMR